MTEIPAGPVIPTWLSLSLVLGLAIALVVLYPVRRKKNKRTFAIPLICGIVSAISFAVPFIIAYPIRASSHALYYSLFKNLSAFTLPAAPLFSLLGMILSFAERRRNAGVKVLWYVNLTICSLIFFACAAMWSLASVWAYAFAGDDMGKRTFTIVFLAIATFAAVVLAFLVYFLTKGQSVEITVGGEFLSVGHTFGDGNYTVVWECDAGSLSSASTGSEYKAPCQSSYYLYAGLNENVIWSPEDDDGFSYPTATVRIRVFKYKDDRRYHKCDNEIYTDTVTVSIRDGRLTEAEKRAFGNPVREGSDYWRQIVSPFRQGHYVVLRYRYGKPLVSPERVCWQTNAVSLCAATFQDAPIYVVAFEYNPHRLLYESDTVCYDFKKFCGAYLDDSDTEQYPAVIKIEAFKEDESGSRSDAAALTITYYYADESKGYELTYS